MPGNHRSSARTFSELLHGFTGAEPRLGGRRHPRQDDEVQPICRIPCSRGRASRRPCVSGWDRLKRRHDFRSDSVSSSGLNGRARARSPQRSATSEEALRLRACRLPRPLSQCTGTPLAGQCSVRPGPEARPSVRTARVDGSQALLVSGKLRSGSRQVRTWLSKARRPAT